MYEMIIKVNEEVEKHYFGEISELMMFCAKHSEQIISAIDNENIALELLDVCKTEKLI